MRLVFVWLRQKKFDEFMNESNKCLQKVPKLCKIINAEVKIWQLIKKDIKKKLLDKFY